MLAGYLKIGYYGDVKKFSQKKLHLGSQVFEKIRTTTQSDHKKIRRHLIVQSQQWKHQKNQ